MDAISTTLFGWVINLPMFDAALDKNAFLCVSEGGGGIRWITLALLVCSLAATMIYYHVLCRDVNKATFSNLFWTLILGFVVLVTTNSILVTWLSYSKSNVDHGVLSSGIFWMLQLVSLVYYFALAEFFAWIGRGKSSGRNHMPLNIFWNRN